MPKSNLRLRATGLIAVVAATTTVACSPDAGDTADAGRAGETTPIDLSLAPIAAEVLTVRPSDAEAPVDDVNWFARPVPHEGDDHIVAFASHNENYLYNLTRGVRVRIPDRSDAVATPDGRFMTVPSSYTPDANIRFYPMQPLLAALEAGESADDLEPAFVHEHPSMKRVYYQSTGVLFERTIDGETVVAYRLMFSGGHDESNFRIVDYRFTLDAAGEVLHVAAGSPMALCPEVRNDLNTPFISKDGRYVAAYTSETEGSRYSPGSSLKVFEIAAVNPASGTTTCRAAVDFRFAAGKADFSFDGDQLTFHISQGGYLTPFINGGLPETTITDVVVARLRRDDEGRIVGHDGLRRVTTSLEAGVGSYFPAFFPDGTLFYIANSVPREREDGKSFHFRVLDVRDGKWGANVFATDADLDGWRTIASLWERSRAETHADVTRPPFPLQPHEAPWLALSLSTDQCRALVTGADTGPDGAEAIDHARLSRLCDTLASDEVGR